MKKITYQDLGRFNIHYDPNTETKFAYNCPHCKKRNIVNVPLELLDKGMLVVCDSDDCRTHFTLRLEITGSFEPLEE